MENTSRFQAQKTCSPKLSSLAQGMLEAVAGEAVTRLPDFNPQELSNILVAYARVNHAHVPLLEVWLGPVFTVGVVHPSK